MCENVQKTVNFRHKNAYIVQKQDKKDRKMHIMEEKVKKIGKKRSKYRAKTHIQGELGCTLHTFRPPQTHAAPSQHASHRTENVQKTARKCSKNAYIGRKCAKNGHFSAQKRIYSRKMCRKRTKNGHKTHIQEENGPKTHTFPDKNAYIGRKWVKNAHFSSPKRI